MTIEEMIEDAADRFGDTYNKEGRGAQMAWAFESGADWMQDHHPVLVAIRDGEKEVYDRAWFAKYEENVKRVAKKEIIDKACEFLQSFNKGVAFQVNIDYFRKAMEE